MTPIKRDYHNYPVCMLTGEKCNPDRNCRHCNIPVMSLLTDILDKMEMEE